MRKWFILKNGERESFRLAPAVITLALMLVFLVTSFYMLASSL